MTYDQRQQKINEINAALRAASKNPLYAGFVNVLLDALDVIQSLNEDSKKWHEKTPSSEQ